MPLLSPAQQHQYLGGLLPSTNQPPPTHSWSFYTDNGGQNDSPKPTKQTYQQRTELLGQSAFLIQQPSCKSL